MSRAARHQAERCEARTHHGGRCPLSGELVEGRRLCGNHHLEDIPADGRYYSERRALVRGAA